MRDILCQTPVTVNLHDNVAKLAHLLLSNSHGGFPVVMSTERGEDVFFGFINRFVLSWSEIKDRHIQIVACLSVCWLKCVHSSITSSGHLVREVPG